MPLKKLIKLDSSTKIAISLFGSLFDKATCLEQRLQSTLIVPKIFRTNQKVLKNPTVPVIIARASEIKNI
jgi:hypothetical protein